jgi:hypothetical protein
MLTSVQSMVLDPAGVVTVCALTCVPTVNSAAHKIPVVSHRSPLSLAINDTVSYLANAIESGRMYTSATKALVRKEPRRKSGNLMAGICIPPFAITLNLFPQINHNIKVRC